MIITFWVCRNWKKKKKKHLLSHKSSFLVLWVILNVQRMNLTAVRGVNEVMERHIEDSLSILPPIKNSYVSHCNNSINNINLVDVGSGAGLPGLILAIACPGEYIICYINVGCYKFCAIYISLFCCKMIFLLTWFWMRRLEGNSIRVYEQAVCFLGACDRSYWLVKCQSCKRKSGGIASVFLLLLQCFHFKIWYLISMFVKVFSSAEITIDYTSIPLQNNNTNWGFMERPKPLIGFKTATYTLPWHYLTTELKGPFFLEWVLAY